MQAIQNFEWYLQLSHQELQIYTDHNLLTFLHHNKFTNQRLLQWSFLLQPFNIKKKKSHPEVTKLHS